MTRSAYWFLGIALWVTSQYSLAQSAKSETLAKIRASGVIHIGHRRDAIPFSYLSGQTGQPIGYSIAICDRIVSALRAQLNLPDLRVQFHPVLAENRVSMVATGRVDMECGSTSNTSTRRKDVDFSVATFAPATRIAVPKNSPIRRVSDLNGRTVAVTKGTNSEASLEQVIAKSNLKVTLIASRDNESSYAALRNSKADALVLNDVLVNGMIADGSDRGRFEFIEEIMPAEPYGIMIRKNDPEFKALVDRAINTLIDNGVMAKLYLQWFRTPIPPKRINLDLPLTEDMARILKLVPR